MNTLYDNIDRETKVARFRAMLRSHLARDGRVDALAARKTLPTEQDKTDTANYVLCIFDLMIDGEWHGKDEIKAAAERTGKPCDDYARRMRELRSLDGWFVERRNTGGRVYEYRLVIWEMA